MALSKADNDELVYGKRDAPDSPWVMGHCCLQRVGMQYSSGQRCCIVNAHHGSINVLVIDLDRGPSIVVVTLSCRVCTKANVQKQGQ